MGKELVWVPNPMDGKVHLYIREGRKYFPEGPVLSKTDEIYVTYVNYWGIEKEDGEDTLSGYYSVKRLFWDRCFGEEAQIKVFIYRNPLNDRIEAQVSER